MKTAIWSVVVGTALLAGCGSSAVRTTGVPEAGVISSSSAALSVDLRLRATGAEDYKSLQLIADDITVIADGVPVAAVDLADDPADLAQKDQAWKLATVRVPANAREIEFAVRIAPAGMFESKTAQGWIDARSTTLRFKATGENLASQGKATLVLDAAKSFVAVDAETLALVPTFAVRY